MTQSKVTRREPPSTPRLQSIFLVVAVAFTAGMAAAISIVDARGGGLLASYFEEYAGGGSCKWRGEEAQRFQLLLTVGVLAWPAGTGAVIVAVRDAILTDDDGKARRRAIAVSAVVVVVAVALLRLASLRAVRGAMGAC